MQLSIPFEFLSTHALPVRTDMHEHLYRLIVVIEGAGPDDQGFLINMSEVRAIIEPRVASLRGTSLNGHALWEEAGEAGVLAARYPTCELMALAFVALFEPKLNALREGVRLRALEVHLINRGIAGEEQEFGSARVECG